MRAFLNAVYPCAQLGQFIIGRIVAEAIVISWVIALEYPFSMKIMVVIVLFDNIQQSERLVCKRDIAITA